MKNMNKEVCERYLDIFNKTAGTKLKLSGRNGYYCIDAIVSEAGACKQVFGGATLKECKDFAVSIVGLWEMIERIE